MRFGNFEKAAKPHSEFKKHELLWVASDGGLVSLTWSRGNVTGYRLGASIQKDGQGGFRWLMICRKGMKRPKGGFTSIWWRASCNTGGIGWLSTTGGELSELEDIQVEKLPSRVIWGIPPAQGVISYEGKRSFKV